MSRGDEARAREVLAQHVACDADIAEPIIAAMLAFAEPRIATPNELRLSADDLSIAATIVDSPTVAGQYASCEWDCLHDDGKQWIAAIVRVARGWDRPANTPNAAAVGAAIEAAWNGSGSGGQPNNLPPNDLTDHERRHIGRAALSTFAASQPTGEMPGRDSEVVDRLREAVVADEYLDGIRLDHSDALTILSLLTPAPSATGEAPVHDDTLRQAIKVTKYKYFGDYEMTDVQRGAVDALVVFAQHHLDSRSAGVTPHG